MLDYSEMAIPGIVAQLLMETPSMQAAMSAGKHCTIAVKVTRADGRVEDYGVVSSHSSTWRQYLRTLTARSKGVIRFVHEGKEIERIDLT